MDGVLVDATPSYRAAAVETAVRFLAAHFRLDARAVGLDWVDALKRAGGFNNDWDLTTALIRGVLARGPDLDVIAFSGALKTAGGGLGAVDRVLGATRDPQLHPRGPIQTLFQQLYLVDPRYIDRERALVTPAELARFQALATLAVATGRPRAEADYALERLGIAPFFATCVTLDDVEEAGALGKPNPWSLIAARDRAGLASDARCAYIGDTPDDMVAAVAAEFVPIGISGGDPALDAALADAGATQIFATAGAYLAEGLRA